MKKGSIFDSNSKDSMASHHEILQTEIDLENILDELQ